MIINIDFSSRNKIMIFQTRGRIFEPPGTGNNLRSFRLLSSNCTSFFLYSSHFVPSDLVVPLLLRFTSESTPEFCFSRPPRLDLVSPVFCRENIPLMVALLAVSFLVTESKVERNNFKHPEQRALFTKLRQLC